LSVFLVAGVVLVGLKVANKLLDERKKKKNK